MVKVLRSIVRGPLEPHVTGFAEELLRQGYSRSSAEQHVCFIAHLDRWMQAEGVGLDGLSGSVIERYLAQRRAAGYVEYRSLKALRPLLGYLAPLGVLPVPAGGSRPARWRNCWVATAPSCSVERGLTPGTARGYVDCVRPFVASRLRGDVLDLAGMTAADVTGFVLAACPGRAVGSAKLIVCALRSLLRWLHLTGAVAGVAGGRGARRSRAGGCPACRRVWSRASCAGCWPLVTGAPRPAGVTTRSCCCWRGWGCAPARSPAWGWTTSTGAAARSRCSARATAPNGCRCRPRWARRSRRICAAAGRAPREGRSVFVRVHAPHRALTTGGVTMVVFDAAQRAGLGKMHAHRLRHTAATAMLRAGSPLAEVGQVLRHRSALTTAIYAKVDRDALAVLARPWPVAGRSAVCRDRPAARGAGRLPRAAPRAGLPAGPPGEAARPVPRPPRTGRRIEDHRRGGAGLGAAARQRRLELVGLPALGGARVRHLPARPGPGARGARRGAAAAAAAAGQPVLVFRRRHRGADRGHQLAAHPAAAGHVRHADRVAGGDRDPGR